MEIVLDNKVLRGEITPPPVKSYVKRNLICAFLSDEVSYINNVVIDEEIMTLINAGITLGSEIEISDYVGKRKSIKIKGSYPFNLKSDKIDTKNSLSLLRLITPLITVAGTKFSVQCGELLVNRPLDSFFNVFFSRGITRKQRQSGVFPLSIKGGTTKNTFYVRGDVDPEYFSSLLFSLPLLINNSKIIMTTPLENRMYIKETLDILELHGIEIQNNNYIEFEVRGNASYRGASIVTENDYAVAGIWLGADALGHKVVVKNMNVNSKQRYKRILDILKGIGAEVFIGDGGNILVRQKNIEAFKLDILKFPDLLSPLAMIASVANGTTRIKNAGHVRNEKGQHVAQQLVHAINSIGGDSYLFQEDMIIRGKDMLRGGYVDHIADHDVIYALTIIARHCANDIIVNMPRKKPLNYLDFYKDYEDLGGKL